MNDLVFSNSEFGDLDVFVENDKIYFPANKCAMILGYKRPADAITAHCKGSVKHRVPTNGGVQEIKYIPEGDLYRLIIGSKMPKAEKFEHWVFDEVLPTIRKTGGYVSDNEKFINIYLPYADEHTKELFRLQLDTISQLNTKIEQDKPKVDFADHISDTSDLVDINAFAKLLQHKGVKIGRTRLFRWLRDNNYLRSNNEPYQQYMNGGYFETREYAYMVKGEPKIGIKTYVTGKGQRYLFNKLQSKWNCEVG